MVLYYIWFLFVCLNCKSEEVLILPFVKTLLILKIVLFFNLKLVNLVPLTLGKTYTLLTLILSNKLLQNWT